MATMCFSIRDCTIAKLESGEFSISGRELELFAVEDDTCTTNFGEKVGDIVPGLLHVVRPNERVVDHLDVPADVVGDLVVAVCIGVTASQPSLWCHLVSV